MTAAPEVVVLADHPIWLAVPAFAPAIVVAGVVVYIAAKNRRKPDNNDGNP
ncbi:hypothetical protein FHR72_000739 [Mycolicibacterium iranicum]|uniref:Uncharacterized protein n=1 Tax=Mycolicibacterium iranicum TaxID=912594 RepID=A0A839Q7T6_MYCIR|nr:hypothetical protein [Mycolicibacterium iranicum]MBB2989282.1 hypothetical protein [Mycolicibacterium iranicum]